MSRPSAANAKFLADITLTAVLVALVASLAQTVSRSDLNPIADGISFYAVGPRGIVQGAAIVVAGLGSIALAIGLRQALPPQPGARLGTLFVALWGLAIVIAGLVPIDLVAPISLAGIVHDAAGTIANIFLIAGMLALAAAFRGLPGWDTFRAPSIALAVLALSVVIAANLLRPELPWGFGQRVYVAILIWWLVLAALRLRAAGPA